MGIRCSLSVLPAEEFARQRADPEYAFRGETPHFSIEKTWFNFHTVFWEQPEPLKYAIQGDIAERPILRNLMLEEDQSDEDGDGVHFGYVSPEMVQKIAAALNALPNWKWMDWLRKANPWWVRHKENRDHFYWAFEELQKAYNTAAAQGAALTVIIC